MMTRSSRRSESKGCWKPISYIVETVLGCDFQRFQKILQCLTTLQVFEKRLNRHSSSPEYGRTVHCFGIFCDRLRRVFVVSHSRTRCAIAAMPYR
jgi:hypothetical protein